MLRKMLGGVGGGDDNVALKTLCRNTAQCTKKGPVASSLEHQNDTFFLIERIVTTIFNCFSPCKCDDIVSRSSNNANTHSSEHSMHIRTKHMSTKHHGHLHAVYLVTSPNICFLDALQNFMQSESDDFKKDVFLIPESHFRNFIHIAYS